jgi:hypothetical protein
MPKPKVAMARYRPERRIAGTAITAPTGTAASPASSREAPNGIPAWLQRAKTAAPTAAKAMWHRDTWPEVRTSRCSEAKMNTKAAAVVNRGTLVAARWGAARRSPPPTTARASAALRGNGAVGASRRTTRDPRSISRSRGVMSSTTKSTRNGTFDGSGCRIWELTRSARNGWAVRYFTTSWATPTAIPPT